MRTTDTAALDACWQPAAPAATQCYRLRSSFVRVVRVLRVLGFCSQTCIQLTRPYLPEEPPFSSGRQRRVPVAPGPPSELTCLSLTPPLVVLLLAIHCACFTLLLHAVSAAHVRACVCIHACSHIFEVQAAATAMDRSQIAVARIRATHFCYQPGIKPVEMCTDPLPVRVEAMRVAVESLEVAHMVRAGPGGATPVALGT